MKQQTNKFKGLRYGADFAKEVRMVLATGASSQEIKEEHDRRSRDLKYYEYDDPSFSEYVIAVFSDAYKHKTAVEEELRRKESLTIYDWTKDKQDFVDKYRRLSKEEIMLNDQALYQDIVSEIDSSRSSYIEINSNHSRSGNLETIDLPLSFVLSEFVNLFNDDGEFDYLDDEMNDHADYFIRLHGLVRE